MAYETMSREEILSRLASDLPFAVDFMLDNNWSEIQSNYEILTGRRVRLKSVMHDIILNGIEQHNQNVIQAISVPYINERNNWTGGFGQFIGDISEITDPSQMQQRGVNWGNVFSAIGAIGTALGGSMNAQQQGQVYDPYLQQQQAMEQLRRQREEEERKRKTTIGIVIGVFALIGTLIIIFAVTSGKPKPKAA